MNKLMIVVAIIVAFGVGLFAGYKYEKDKLVNMSATTAAMYLKQINDLKMSQQSMQASPAANTVFAMKTDPKLGQYLTDPKGMTLYTFDKDTKGVSTCTGACAAIWLPYAMPTGTDTTKLPTDVTAIKRDDGTWQYAFKGMPLYFFKSDVNPGDTKGDGVAGVWHVAK